MLFLDNQIGTDIEDFKCSWLVVQALERVNDEQRKILYVKDLFFFIFCCKSMFDRLLLVLIMNFFFQENYGKADSACVEKVKRLYKDLDLEVGILSLLIFALCKNLNLNVDCVVVLCQLSSIRV